MHESTLRQATAQFRKIKTEEFFHAQSNKLPLEAPEVVETQQVFAACSQMNSADSRSRLNQVRAALESTLMPNPQARNTEMLTKMTRAEAAVAEAA
jgi:hypothetical protein